MSAPTFLSRVLFIYLFVYFHHILIVNYSLPKQSRVSYLQIVADFFRPRQPLDQTKSVKYNATIHHSLALA